MTEKILKFKEKIEKELTLEEKRNLVEFWQKVVLEIKESPDNLDEMSNEELKKWLYETLNIETEKLTQEWKLKPNQNLIEKLSNENDPENKAEIEKEIIFDLHEQINQLKNFDNRKWDFYPAQMRKTRRFTCVGISLIGRVLLDQAGIKNKLGLPVGHRVNLAKLSNGDLWYVDFNKDKSQVRQLLPKTIELEGNKLLKVQDHFLDYKLIPETEKEACLESILGNFGALIEEAKSKKEDETVKVAREIFSENEKLLEKIDFYSLLNKIFPEISSIFSSKKNNIERKKINRKRLLFDKGREIFSKIGQKMNEKFGNIQEEIDALGEKPPTPENNAKYQVLIEAKRKNEARIEELRKELKDNLDNFRFFLLDGDPDLLVNFSEENKFFAQTIRDDFSSLRKENPQMYKVLMESIVEKIHLKASM